MKTSIIRLSISLITLINSVFAFSQSPDCLAAVNFCGVTMTFPNVTGGGTSLGGVNYGCISTPTSIQWVYLKTDNPGQIKIELKQTSGVNSGIDVDFALWGPYTSLSSGCSSISTNINPIQSSSSPAPIEYIGIGVQGGDTTMCQSPSPNNMSTPPPAQTGEYYIIAISNYADISGNITCTQVNANTSNAGSLSCDNSGCNLNANYNVSTSTCQVGSFTINTFNPNNHYQWDFGDGHVSIANTNFTSHNYTASGSFTTKLHVWNDTCPDTITVLKNITIANCNNPNSCALDTNFTFVQLNDTTYSFSPSTIVSGYNYHWVFSDGKTSSLKQPTHIFPSHGNYFVTLVVSNCSCSQSKTIPLSVQDTCMLSGHFSYTSTGLGKYQFTPSNQSSQLSYSWDFGDGISSSISNPNHTYQTAGTYNVILTVSSNYCSVKDSLPLTAVLTNPCAIDAQFTYSDLGNGKYKFTPDSTNNNYTYSWNFGDGNSSSSKTPTYTFSGNGDYTVILTVTSGNCTIKDTQVVHVTSINQCPFYAHFGYTDLGNGKFKFTPDTLNNSFAYAWDFGDGNSSSSKTPTYTFSGNGDYTVILTITSGNCVKKDTVIIHLTNLGLIQNSGNNGISIFPNPFDSYITISNPTTQTEQLTVQLYDLQGKLISEQVVLFNNTEHQKKIDIPALSTAAYFIKITNENGLIIKSQTLLKE